MKVNPAQKIGGVEINGGKYQSNKAKNHSNGDTN